MPWKRHRPKQPPNPIWFFEQPTIPPGAAQPGILPLPHPGLVTLFLMIPIMVFFWPLYGPLAPVLAFVAARLLVLDLTTYLLPNLYTYPLIAGGLVWAWGQGYGPYALILVVVMLVLRAVFLSRPNLKLGMGGGDFALLAALCGWLEPQVVFCAIAIGCILWLPFTFLTPQRAVPLGVPIILGWVSLLVFFSRMGLFSIF